MDVYENAKLFRKYRTKQQLSTGIIQKQSNNRNERLSHVAFGSKMANDLNVNYVERKNASRQQQRHFKRDLSFHENANEVNNEIFSLSDTNFVTDAFTTTTTTTTSATTITATTNSTSNTDIVNRFMDPITGETMRYETIEAHCNCANKLDMECIIFESVPPSDYAKCICTFDNKMDIAWPCFNISACFEDGFCEPKQDYLIQSVNWPCLCRNRTTDS
ncbi:unnamed protein product, partial [Acanthocheilonema viteae]